MVTQYNKAITAITTGFISFLALKGFSFKWLTPDLINVISVVVTSFFVWLIPNKKK